MADNTFINLCGKCGTPLDGIQKFCQTFGSPTFPPKNIYDVKQGDIIKFGQYYQANDSSEEDIEWRVLAVENSKALLLSEKILDCKPFNEKWEAATWET